MAAFMAIPRERVNRTEPAGAPVGSYSSKYKFIDKNIPTREYFGEYFSPENKARRTSIKEKGICSRVERGLVKYRDHQASVFRIYDENGALLNNTSSVLS